MKKLIILIFFLSIVNGYCQTRKIGARLYNYSKEKNINRLNTELDNIYYLLRNLYNTRVEDKTGYVMPVGAVIVYSTNTAPTGWLLCDGATISRTEYAELFFVLGTTYGAGDGSTTFHLPDFRGRFLRGWDDGQGRDPDSGTRTAMNTGGNTADNIGSVQDDAFQGHYHDMGWNAAGALSSVQVAATGDATPVNINNTYAAVLNPRTDGTNGTPRTTSETRAKNAYVNYIIKY